MSEVLPLGSPDTIGKLATVSDASACARLVLEVYSALMASSPNERGAFDAAVRTYLTHNPSLPEAEARRAVAKIICGRQ
jgi:hypothetical protein